MTLLNGQFLFAENESGWMVHSHGLERLLELCGPEAATSSSSLLILERSRPPIILEALLSHRRTIFSRPEWKQGPWLVHPEQKDSMAFLVDIMADCVELFYLRAEVMSSSNSNTAGDPEEYIFTWNGIRQTAYSILGALDHWEQVYMPASPPHCTQVPLPNTSESAGRSAPPWSTVFHFSSHYHAKVMSLYCSTLVLVLQFILNIPSTTGKGDDNYEALQDRMQSAGIAICRTIDYHTRLVLERSDRSFLTFPLRMASEAIEDRQSPAGQWLEAIHKSTSIGTLSGRSQELSYHRVRHMTQGV
jgi:hypothetical protein